VAITVAALFMMPILARGKRNVGRALNSRTLLADAAETTLCALLSATGILGLGFNARFGWHWADPVAGLVISGVCWAFTGDATSVEAATRAVSRLRNNPRSECVPGSSPGR
jgi:divalent metal cation (Fe/Co/Zn/Cd) transporter